ncbi:MAG: hypothetical protein AB8G05_15950 [Oligoflexales bacterium]
MKSSVQHGFHLWLTGSLAKESSKMKTTLTFLLTLFLSACGLKEESKQKKYLLFSSVGNNSIHEQWLDCNREFKSILYYWDQDQIPDSKEIDELVVKKGFKYPNFYHYYINHKEEVLGYDAIFIPDDDLRISCQEINRLFTVFTANNLWLAQPSLDKDSLHSWPITLQTEDSLLRYTNFVENQAAIIDPQNLEQYVEVFAEAKTGFGVDFILTHKLNYPIDRIAIIDAISVHHPYNQSSLNDKVARSKHPQEGAALMMKHGLNLGIDDPSEYDYGMRPPFEIKEYSSIKLPKK